MNRNQKITAASGAGAAGVALVAAGLVISGTITATHDEPTMPSAQRSVASTDDVNIDRRDDSHRARLRIGTTPTGVGLTGQDSTVGTSGVPRPGRASLEPIAEDGIVINVPRRVIVTLPSYKAGSPPQVTPPSYQRGTDPSVQTDRDRIVVEMGDSGSLAPPSVHHGEPGTLTPPSVDVE